MLWSSVTIWSWVFGGNICCKVLFHKTRTLDIRPRIHARKVDINNFKNQPPFQPKSSNFFKSCTVNFWKIGIVTSLILTGSRGKVCGSLVTLLITVKKHSYERRFVDHFEPDPPYCVSTPDRITTNSHVLIHLSKPFC